MTMESFLRLFLVCALFSTTAAVCTIYTDATFSNDQTLYFQATSDCYTFVRLRITSGATVTVASNMGVGQACSISCVDCVLVGDSILVFTGNGNSRFDVLVENATGTGRIHVTGTFTNSSIRIVSSTLVVGQLPSGISGCIKLQATLMANTTFKLEGCRLSGNSTADTVGLILGPTTIKDRSTVIVIGVTFSSLYSHIFQQGGVSVLDYSVLIVVNSTLGGNLGWYYGGSALTIRNRSALIVRGCPMTPSSGNPAFEFGDTTVNGQSWLSFQNVTYLVGRRAFLMTRNLILNQSTISMDGCRMIGNITDHSTPKTVDSYSNFVYKCNVQVSSTNAVVKQLNSIADLVAAGADNRSRLILCNSTSCNETVDLNCFRGNTLRSDCGANQCNCSCMDPQSEQVQCLFPLSFV